MGTCGEETCLDIKVHLDEEGQTYVSPGGGLRPQLSSLKLDIVRSSGIWVLGFFQQERAIKASEGRGYHPCRDTSCSKVQCIFHSGLCGQGCGEVGTAEHGWKQLKPQILFLMRFPWPAP